MASCRARPRSTPSRARSRHIEVSRSGKAMVVGKLREDDFHGAELSFRFESDLSFLEKTRSELTQIVAAFPNAPACPEITRVYERLRV